MRENNRNPIEKCRKKLPQFTTMNVIDGQAGLVIYSSLIFYSLTIDNILNIIVLLILAGVSISMLTGENGILTQAQNAKNKTEETARKEEQDLAELEAIITGKDVVITPVHDDNPGVLEGEGTENKPFVINSIEDLVAFADSVTNGNTYEGQYVKLNQSLDFKSDKSYVDPNREDYYGYTGKLKEALTTGEGFKPIGTTIKKKDITDITNSFCGVFDGNEKQIINCYMNKNISNLETINRFALFGASTFGDIKNLGLTKVDFTLTGNKGRIGIAGITNDSMGKITNCYVTGNITGIQNGSGNIYCSGIATGNAGVLENNFNAANIKLLNTSGSSEVMENYCAGITGQNPMETSVIRNCYNTGDITVELNTGSAEIGGISGILDLGTIENCYNNGKINLKVDETLNGDDAQLRWNSRTS